MAVMAPTMANGGKLSYGWEWRDAEGTVVQRSRAGGRAEKRAGNTSSTLGARRTGRRRANRLQRDSRPQRCDATRGAEAGVRSSLGYDSLVDPLPRKAVRARTGAARVSFDEIIAVRAA